MCGCGRTQSTWGWFPNRPENFLDFVQSLLETARLFRPLLAASRVLKKDGDRLEAVLFNERNGLGERTVAILAAIHPTDRPSEAKDKGRLVASFIDRWYVLQVLQDLPVQAPDVAELVHGTLVPVLRECRTTADVAAALGQLALRDGNSIPEASTLGFRGNNSHQIRYLLARATAYVEESCERPQDVLAYLDRTQFRIEHLWANHPRRTEKEIPDPVVFRSLRNQLGGLGLLAGRENSSINDMPLHEKAYLYARSNILLGIISPGYDRRNPLLRGFIKSHQLDKLLRSFGPKETMTSVIQTRQQLYLRLFELIWNPEQLGFLTPTPQDTPQPDQTPVPQPRATPARRKTARRRTDVAKMLDARILTAGTRIVLTHRSVDHWATINQDGGVVLNATGGTPYGRVDEAGAVVRGAKTCQGMKEWHIEDETGARLSLRTLRDQAVAAGLM